MKLIRSLLSIWIVMALLFSCGLAEGEKTPENTLTAGQREKIFEAYQVLLSSAKGDFPGYYIYDIDKDGIPELLLTVQDGPDQGLEVWTWSAEEGRAFSAGILWGFANGMPIPASCPEGNGIVLTQIARDYECIWLITKEGMAMSGDRRTDANSLYAEPLYTPRSNYYQNSEEGYGVSVGHQYRSVTVDPYYEDSRLLGFNAPSDFTALAEAIRLF